MPCLTTSGPFSSCAWSGRGLLVTHCPWCHCHNYHHSLLIGAGCCQPLPFFLWRADDPAILSSIAQACTLGLPSQPALCWHLESSGCVACSFPSILPHTGCVGDGALGVVWAPRELHQKHASEQMKQSLADTRREWGWEGGSSFVKMSWAERDRMGHPEERDSRVWVRAPGTRLVGRQSSLCVLQGSLPPSGPCSAILRLRNSHRPCWEDFAPVSLRDVWRNRVELLARDTLATGLPGTAVFRKLFHRCWCVPWCTVSWRARGLIDLRGQDPVQVWVGAAEMVFLAVLLSLAPSEFT